MNQFQIRKHVVYTTDHRPEDATWYIRGLMRGFFHRRRLWKSVIARHSKDTGLPHRPVILCAHGEVRNRRWHFWDAQKRRRHIVQQWIDDHDGDAAALLVFCCNTLNAEIHATRSLVIHLNRAASLWDLWHGGRLRLFHPKFGYIENNYYRLHQILGT